MPPKIEIGLAKEDLKGEDVLLLRTKVRFRSESGEPQTRGRSRAPTSLGDPNVYNLLCVFDGHNGGEGAVFLQTNLEKVLHEKMPFGPCPERDDRRWKPFRTQIQKALVETVAVLESDFAKQGLKDGSTLTVVVLITADHRIAVNKPERHRLEGLGRRVAPLSESSISGGGGEFAYAKPGEKGYGPLRVWPGGLCLSRSFGDFDVGEGVLCFPHVFQVLVPEEGGRLVVASDGVWDAFPKTSQWLRHLRHGTPESAGKKLIAAIKAAYQQKLKDDTTILIADVLPQNVGYFPEVLVNYKAPPQGCFSCLAPPADDSCKAPAARVLTDLDIAALMNLVPDAQINSPPEWFTEEFKADMDRRSKMVFLDYKAASGNHEEAATDGLARNASVEAQVLPEADSSPRAHPRKRMHVRFAEDEPVIDIPAVYGGEEALKNGSMDAHSPPPVWEEAGGDSHVPLAMMDISTRLGTRFYDSVPDGQMADHFASSTKGSAEAGAHSRRPRDSVTGRSPDRLMTSRIIDTDPTVRGGTEFLRGDSGGEASDDEEPLSYSVRNTDPTVRMGSKFRSPNRRGSPPPGAAGPDTLQDISTRLHSSRTSAFHAVRHILGSLMRRTERELAADKDAHEGLKEEVVSQRKDADGAEPEVAPGPPSAGAHLDEEDFYPPEADDEGDLLRANASHFFPSSVVEDPADYAAQLGRYRHEPPDEKALATKLERPSLLHRISRQVDSIFTRRSHEPPAALHAKSSSSSAASAPGSMYSKVDSTRAQGQAVRVLEGDEQAVKKQVQPTPGPTLAEEQSASTSAADHGSDVLKKNASVHFPSNVAEDPADYALRLGRYRNEAGALEASEAKLQRPSMLQRLSRQVDVGFKRNSQQHPSTAVDDKLSGSTACARLPEDSGRKSHRPPAETLDSVELESRPPLEKESPYTSSQGPKEETRVRDGRAVMALIRSSPFLDHASTSSDAFPGIVAEDVRPTTNTARAAADGGAATNKKENPRTSQALGESSLRKLGGTDDGTNERAGNHAASRESGLQEPASRDASQRLRPDSKSSEPSSPEDSAHAAGGVPPVNGTSTNRTSTKAQRYARSQWSMS